MSALHFSLSQITSPIYAVPVMVIPLVSYITGELDRFDVVEGFARSILSSPDIVPAFFQAARIGLGLIAVQRRP